ncbi:MAG: hypothetical protein ACYDBJ_09590 [Aggregatilineales bacterium]
MITRKREGATAREQIRRPRRPVRPTAAIEMTAGPPPGGVAVGVRRTATRHNCNSTVSADRRRERQSGFKRSAEVRRGLVEEWEGRSEPARWPIYRLIARLGSALLDETRA